MELETLHSIDTVPAAWDDLAPRGQVGLEREHLRAIERSRINHIEPVYVVARAAGRAVGIAHAFLMNLDLAFLDRTLPRETLQTLRSWHHGYMKTRVLECGFVSGLGEAVAAREGWRAEVCPAVVGEMERVARDAGAELLLVRDVPHRRYEDYRALEARGFRPLLGFPIARLDVRWSSIDAYLDCLKATSRWRVKRMRTHGPDLTSEVLTSFGEHAPRLTQLWRQTHAKATDYSHEELNEEYFRQIDERLGDRSRVVVLRRGAEIVAFSLCLVGDQEYFSSHAGLDYSRTGDDNLHFCLSMAVLEDALGRGARSINRGITSYDVKFALGFEADPQVYLVKHLGDARLTSSVARKLQDSIVQPENAHRPFRGQDTSRRPDLQAIAAALTPPSAPDVFGKAYSYSRANDARLAGLYGFFPAFESAQGPVVRHGGRRVVMLGSNAYLGLGTHPLVAAAAQGAVRRYGTGCSGSPLLNGTLDLHADLARALADFLGKEDAVLCSTGYQTNVGVVSALVGKGDVVVMDRLDHASLFDGARMAQAEVVRFRHNDMESLEHALRAHPDRGKLIVVDSVFSMEGTVADLTSIVRLKREYGARLMVDEAHAIGVLGPTGGGAAEQLGVLPEVDVVMGTFSKSFASVGGFVAGEARVIDYLRHAARSHMFSASLPPAAVAAARAALAIMRTEPERRAHVLANAEYMAHRLQELGYEAPYRGTAIVPVHCGRDVVSFALFKKLLDEGVFVNPVASPAVPVGHELLRTSYMATHERAQLDEAAAVFARVRTASFPRRRARAASVARRAAALRVRPLVILPVADRRSFERDYASGARGVVRVPGFTHLDLGETVDCGISFGREAFILQSPAVVVSKALVQRRGRPLGIEVALQDAELPARRMIEQLLDGGPIAGPGRRSWRYHAEVEMDGHDGAPLETDVLDDIGLDGASFRSSRKVTIGERLPLRFRAPDVGPVALTGEVRWRRRGDHPGFGVRFDLHGDDARDGVGRIISRIRAAIAQTTHDVVARAH